MQKMVFYLLGLAQRWPADIWRATPQAKQIDQKVLLLHIRASYEYF